MTCGSRISRRCELYIGQPMSDFSVVPTMVSHLRACAVDLVKRASNGSAHPVAKGTGATRRKIDKSVLTLAEPKRIRCKEHLRFVASQPCLICGRVPSHAHHVRYAQSKGLSLKVSDEFTVPLCAIHHRNIHTTGKEREWWQERKIDPLRVAGRLWQRSRARYPIAGETDLPELPGDGTDRRQSGTQASDDGSRPGVAAASQIANARKETLGGR